MTETMWFTHALCQTLELKPFSVVTLGFGFAPGCIQLVK